MTATKKYINIVIAVLLLLALMVNFTIIAKAAEYPKPDDEVNLSFDTTEEVYYYDRDPCRLWFGDEIFIDLRADRTTKYRFRATMDNTISTIERRNKNAEMQFYKFSQATKFDYSCLIGLKAFSEARYLYEINNKNELSSISVKWDDDYMTFRTSQLGSYVISDRRLQGADSNSSRDYDDDWRDDSSSTTDAGWNIDINDGAQIVSDTLHKAFTNKSKTTYATLSIKNEDWVYTSTLQTRLQDYTLAGVTFRRVYDKQTRYTWSATKEDLLKLTGEKFNPGMYIAPKKWQDFFQKYYLNDFLVVQGVHGKNTGILAKYQIPLDNSNIKNVDNLIFYIYDVQNNSISKYNTKYSTSVGDVVFTAPLGSFIVISDEPLVRAR